MRRIALMLVLLLAAALPAHAQGRATGGGNQTPELSAEEKEKLQELDKIERNYKATMQRTRSQDAPARVDPWANMRGSEPPAAKR